MRDSGFKVAVPQPFRFERCLAYMARSPLECLYEVQERRVVRLVKVAGMAESVLLDIACPDDRALHVRVTPVGNAGGLEAMKPNGASHEAAEPGVNGASEAAGGEAGSARGEREREDGRSGERASTASSGMSQSGGARVASHQVAQLGEISERLTEASQCGATQPGAALGERELDLLQAYVRDWFDLDRDLEPWQRMAEADPLLGELAREMYGLRLIGIPDLFEALCWAIAGQQVNLAFAYKLKRRLTEAYGAAAVREGRVYRRFPEPAAVAGADVSELRELQLTHAKAAAIREVAALMSRGELSRAALLQLGDFDAAERELVRVRGIGPWTAHYVRMRCLRDPRAFPIGDAGLHNAVKARLGLERKPTPQELQALFANWAGWEAYATFYLWHSLY